MVEQGLRAVYEPSAVCYEETNRHMDKELQVRVRIITRTLTDLWRHRAMMNPWRGGFYAVQLFSHKVLRYIAAILLIGMLVSSGPLIAHSPLYGAALAAQLCVYAAAAAACIAERWGVHNRLFAVPQYFVLANIASLMGIWKFMRGERCIRWEPVREPASRSAAALAAPALHGTKGGQYEGGVPGAAVIPHSEGSRQ
jgi:hypothetical protein